MVATSRFGLLSDATAKKGYASTATASIHLLKTASTDVTIKADSVLTKLIRKDDV